MSNTGTMSQTEPGLRSPLPPCGFDAGDANLRRYVGNDPTDQVDPSGESADDVTVSAGDLQSTYQSSNAITKEIDASVNGNKIHGKITAATNASAKSGVTSFLQRGVYLGYQGDGAGRVKWVQFIRVGVKATGQYTGEAQLQWSDESFVSVSADVPSWAYSSIETSTKDHPKYYVDTFSTTEPYYTAPNPGKHQGIGGMGQVGGEPVSWLWDGPGIVYDVAEKAWSKWGDRQFGFTVGQPVFRATAYYDSFAVLDGQVIAHVPWTYSVQFGGKLPVPQPTPPVFGPAKPSNGAGQANVQPGGLLPPAKSSLVLWFGTPVMGIGTIDQAQPSKAQMDELLSKYGKDQSFITK